MSKFLSWSFAFLQFVMPKHLLTALVYRIARIRLRPVKDFLIRRFSAFYAIDVEEAASPVPDGYATLNDFFTHSLADGARLVDSSAESIVSPVDGTVSAAGSIDSDMLFQAKGKRYSLADLLMTDIDDANRFIDGMFATLYLAPHNYHRVHSPAAARLVAARYVPGALYSVNDATVSLMPGLFTRNERLICHFARDSAPFTLILVGALNVGSISTPWTGEIRPRRKGVVREIDVLKNGHPTEVAKGDLVGTFNMGSTVIVLFPPGSVEFDACFTAGARIRMGEAVGRNVA